MVKSFSKREMVLVVLGGIFVANAILGELIGGKLIQLGPFAMSIGVIPWPVVFVTSDLINEYFGRTGVRRLTFLTVIVILYAFLLLYVAIRVPAAGFSPVNDVQFKAVFGQSLWIIFGSLVAFMISQLVDVIIFWIFRARTQGRMLWLRATGSTAVSQLIDSFVIIAIAFWLPGKVKTQDFLTVAVTNYSYKLIIAIILTPLIYFGHNMIDRFLGEEESHRLIEKAVEESVHTTS